MKGDKEKMLIFEIKANVLTNKYTIFNCYMKKQSKKCNKFIKNKIKIIGIIFLNFNEQKARVNWPCM